MLTSWWTGRARSPETLARPFSAPRLVWKALSSHALQVNSLKGLLGSLKVEATYERRQGESVGFWMNFYFPLSACHVFSQTLSHTICLLQLCAHKWESSGLNKHSVGKQQRRDQSLKLPHVIQTLFSGVPSTSHANSQRKGDWGSLLSHFPGCFLISFSLEMIFHKLGESTTAVLSVANSEVAYQLFNAKCLCTRHYVKMAPSLPQFPPS